MACKNNFGCWDEIPLFDSLAHLTPDGRWFDTTYDASIERLLAEVQQHKVQGLVLSDTPQIGVTTETKDLALLESKIQVCRLPLVRSNKGVVDFANARRHLLDEAVVGIKIHPRYLGISVADPQVFDLIDLVRESGKCLFICSVGAQFDSAHSADYLWRNVFNYLNGAKLVVLHGGSFDLFRVSELSRPFNSVLIDLSFTLPTYFDSSIGFDIVNLVRRFDRRICVGTDFPEFSYGDIKNAFESLQVPYCKITWGNIFCHNLKEFIGA